MAITVKHDNLSNGVSFITILDTKFKANVISVRFITKLDESTASANALIPNILISCNEKLRTRTEITTTLAKLYDSNLSANAIKFGDNQIMNVSADFICDKYALEGEKISQQVSDILLDCIFRPIVNDNAFADEEFTLRKNELVESIEGQINDKRAYAFVRANRTIYKDEPSAVASYGTKETTEKLTSQQVYKEYKNLLENSQIEITLSGGQNLDEVKEKLKKEFAELKRNVVKYTFYSISPVKNEVAYPVDTLDVKQCKMVMAFKTDYTDYFANRLMAAMFGGTAFSKLFMNVREKYSLCYYCASVFIEAKGVLAVDSGVEKVNVEKAKKEIINQLELMAKGDFTEEEQSNAVLSIAGDFKSNYDSVRDISAWYMSQKIRNTDFTPEQAIEKLKAVTKEQIIKAAKSYKLDTVYLMQGKEDNE